MVLFARGMIGGASCTSFHLLYLITGTCVCVYVIFMLCYHSNAMFSSVCMCVFLRCVTVTKLYL